MTTYNTLKEINEEIALTPWQKDIEKTILIHKSNLKAHQYDIYRQFVTLVNAMESRQHWAGDRYTGHLLEKANDLILKVNDVNP